MRKGDRRLVRDSGPWEEFGLRMLSTRARYHFNKEWDGLAEYRWLSDITGENDRHGALLALYNNITDHFNVGVGFNFTDFSSDLRDLRPACSAAHMPVIVTGAQCAVRK